MSTARLLRLPQLARLLTVALAFCLALGVFAPRSQAAPAPEPPAPGGSGAIAPQPATDTDRETAEAERGTGRTTPARERAPFIPNSKKPSETTAKTFGSAAPTAAEVACNVADFASRTGSALVQHIKSVDFGCVNQLFTVTGSDAYNVFREAQMVTVADALRANAASYPGDNTTATSQLVLFLRAGYFVQWYNADTVGSYGTTLQTAIRGALDTFFNNAHSRDVTAGNAPILGESVTLIDSAQENVRYLPVVKRLLTDYNASAYNPVGMAAPVNSAFTVLFRGHQVPGFTAAVKADQSLLDALYNFTAGNIAQLGTGYGYLPYNSARELGRFLQYADLQPKVRPLMQGLAQQSSPSGTRAYLWAAVAEMVAAYDSANAAYYGTTDAAARLRSGILTTNHTCSPSIRIAAQQVTSENLSAACSSLLAQDAYFHSVARDNGPVANDNNSTIEVVVFDTRFDYQVFAAAIFGIRTDNGGMYLEGEPSTPGNLPRFLAYEADWVKPAFEVWNLNHEYTHYLDGRYDMFGNFNAGMTTPTIWWVEGFAEYVSYSYRKLNYDAAINAAGQHTYKLSTLFDTTYDNTTSERTYRWGYLAVRYMLEKHRADTDAVLAKYRTGDWAGARTLLKDTIGTRYDADFDSWLTACAAGACATAPTDNKAPTAAFDAAVNGSTVAFTDRSTDADGTIAARSWDFGDGTGSTAANPSKTYSASGTYTVTLTVTDDKGAKATATRQVAVTVALPECTGADTRQLGQNCRRSNLSATTGNYAHFYLYVPAGTKQLTVTSGGGTGNGDLYYNGSGWAYTNAYTTRSANAGNGETLTVTDPPAGYVYFSLYAQEGFSGANVSMQY